MSDDAHLLVLRRNLERALYGGRMEEAEALLARLEAEAPLAAETQVLRLEYLVRAGRVDDAKPLAEQVERLHGGSARGLFWCGRRAYSARAYADAERLFAESGRVHEHWSSHRWRGKAQTQLGRYDDAEALLIRLAHKPPVQLDLAWLYERRGDLERALDHVTRALEHDPDNAFANLQRTRLRARVVGPEALVEDAELLEALGDPLPSETLADYVDALLRTGRPDAARRIFRARIPEVDARTATSMAWAAHKLHAFDLSYEGFTRVVRANLNDPKFFGALGRAARMCGRLEELAELYERLAPDAPKLYGQAKRLRRG